MAQTVKPLPLRNRVDAFFGLSLRIIGTVFLTRLILDTGTRIVFPFIPQIAEGLGLTVVGFGWLLFIRAMAGTTGPIFGVLADRYGRRKVMTLGLICEGLGVIGLTFLQQWWAAVAIIFSGLSLAAFLPAQQAYISDRVSYQKRGRVLATVEFSWASAGILSLPLAGWMIDTFGWRSPFFALGLFSLIAAGLVWLRLPPVEHHAQTGLTWNEVQTVCLRPNVVASIGASFLVFVAISAFLAMWGVWLTTDFGLDAAAIGLVATAIGVAELGGSGTSSLFIDRVGKRRGSRSGLLLTGIALLLLPLNQDRFVGAVATLIVTALFLEFTIVSLIPLYSEQAPEARGTVLSLVLLGSAIGAAIGPPVTAILWDQFGLWAVCVLAAACLFGAFAVTGRFLRDG